MSKITIEPIPRLGTREAVTMHGPITVGVYPPQEQPARQWRMDAGWTLRGAADLLGLKPSQVSDLERGRARPCEGWPALKAAYMGVP